MNFGLRKFPPTFGNKNKVPKRSIRFKILNKKLLSRAVAHRRPFTAKLGPLDTQVFLSRNFCQNFMKIHISNDSNNLGDYFQGFLHEISHYI